MIPRERILEKLDSLLEKNEYTEAIRLIRYWSSEADFMRDKSGKLLMENELMGLYRKTGEKENALTSARNALDLVVKMGIEQNVGAATTYLNSATVFKAFDMPEEAIPLFEKAKTIYERELPDGDERLGGLYNNMGLALTDLRRFQEADIAFSAALSVMKALPEKEPEEAITYLNMASAAEAESGLEKAKEKIDELVKKAEECMEIGKDRADGNYAFVCEKCASVFGYYGYDDYAKKLIERSRRIHEGT